MVLEEAKNIIKNFRTFYMGGDIPNDTLQGIYEAIDTVLKELDNRISIGEIEKILEATKQLREKEIKELGMSLRGSAVDILENILKKYKE